MLCTLVVWLCFNMFQDFQIKWTYGDTSMKILLLNLIKQVLGSVLSLSGTKRNYYQKDS